MSLIVVARVVGGIERRKGQGRRLQRLSTNELHVVGIHGGLCDGGFISFHRDDDEDLVELRVHVLRLEGLLAIHKYNDESIVSNMNSLLMSRALHERCDVEHELVALPIGEYRRFAIHPSCSSIQATSKTIPSFQLNSVSKQVDKVVESRRSTLTRERCLIALIACPIHDSDFEQLISVAVL